MNSAPNTGRCARLEEIFPGVPRMALTATADPRTRDDILAALDMQQARVFIASFHRPNLNITATEKSDGDRQVLGFLKRHEGQGGHRLLRQPQEDGGNLRHVEAPRHAGRGVSCGAVAN